MEDENIRKNGKRCGHCNRKTLQLHEYDSFVSHVDST